MKNQSYTSQHGKQLNEIYSEETRDVVQFKESRNLLNLGGT